MDYSLWKEINLDVQDILLDYDNPRVFIDDPTQENLLRFLVTEYESIELANGINISRGLPLAEKPVVTLENGKYIVLEGNRRISACKILLNPSLLTEEEARKIPKIDKEMEEYLSSLPVVIAPSRDSAEAFITMRHSGEKGIKRWSTISTTKRFINRFRKGESVNEIARVLSETSSDVRKGIRFFQFLEFVQNQLDWTEEEKKKLAIYKLETTKLDRFLPFSKKAKEVLRIEFTNEHTIKTDLSIDKFKKAVKIIIKRVYLDDEIDTRSNMDDVFNQDIIDICNEPEVYEEHDGDITKSDEENVKEESTTFRDTPEDSATTISAIQENQRFTSEEDSNDHSIYDSTQQESVEEKNKKNSRRARAAQDPSAFPFLLSAHPFSNKYKKNNRINTLLKELRNIKYKEYKMSSTFLIRGLLETYTHEYVDLFIEEQDRTLRIKGVAKERASRKELRELLFNSIKIHLQSNFPEYVEEIKLIELSFTNNNNTATTQIINFYIHAQKQVPDSEEILNAWKKISSILGVLDDVLYQYSKK